MNDSAAPHSDRELLDRHAAGDETAFRQFIARNRDQMWEFALRMTGDPQLAADAVQDAFLLASQRHASLRADSSVTTWLRRLVSRAVIERLQRRELAPRPAEQPREPASPDFAEELARRGIDAAIDMLPEEQRAAVRLVDVLGYSVEKTAQMLGMPQGTVQSRAARGRAQLAELLRRLRSDTPVEYLTSEQVASRLLERFFSRPGVAAETVEATAARVNTGLERLFRRLGPPEGVAGE